MNKINLPGEAEIEIQVYIKIPGSRYPLVGTTVLTSERKEIEFKYAADPVQRGAYEVLDRIWPDE